MTCGEDDYTRAPFLKKAMTYLISIVAGVTAFLVARFIIPFIVSLLAFVFSVVVLAVVYAISIELFVHGNKERRDSMMSEYW